MSIKGCLVEIASHRTVGQIFRREKKIGEVRRVGRALGTNRLKPNTQVGMKFCKNPFFGRGTPWGPPGS